MPSQFEDAEEEAPARVAPMAQSLLAQVGPWRHAQRARCASPPHSLVSRTRCLWQEASKYGTRTAAPAPAPVATAKGGLFTAYGQDRYTPVLPTELAEDRDVLHLGVFGGVERACRLF